MALTIVATVGSASANSFVTEAEAIAHAATRLNLSGWATVAGATATENEKAALIEATRMLSALVWPGMRTDATQVLTWPRNNVTDPDGISSGSLIDNDVIPDRLKRGTIELAIQFLASGTTDIGAVDPDVGVVSQTIDVISTTWELSAKKENLRRFPRVWSEIAPLFGPTGVVRLVR